MASAPDNNWGFVQYLWDKIQTQLRGNVRPQTITISFSDFNYLYQHGENFIVHQFSCFNILDVASTNIINSPHLPPSTQYPLLHQKQYIYYNPGVTQACTAEFFLDSADREIVYLGNREALMAGMNFVITTIPGQRLRILTPLHLFQMGQGQALVQNNAYYGHLAPQGFAQPISQHPQMAPSAPIPANNMMYVNLDNQLSDQMQDLVLASQPSTNFLNGQGPASMYPLETANAMPMQASQHHPASSMEPSAGQQHIASPSSDGTLKEADPDPVSAEYAQEEKAAMTQADIALATIHRTAIALATGNGSSGRGRNSIRIRRPTNTFMLFRSYNSGLMREKNKHIKNAEISRTLGGRWSKMSDKEKQPWREAAALVWAEHKRYFPEWRYEPTIRRNVKASVRQRTTQTSVQAGVQANTPANQGGVPGIAGAAGTAWTAGPGAN
ncbi:hypothetical protein GQX73_g2875 [Xylaria multiplex]|uniref:HMG box domain-containing protein n=1 Tax=Xylaria multiplex TaxID=323545 RepID=A0A7C8N824_9PEZI|nr:hypothetical protein GQX73_g2875 [Xylaria multiplex]